MKLIVYDDEVRPNDDDRKGRRANNALFFEQRLDLSSVLYGNENRESFVLKPCARNENNDGLEELLQAEEAMVHRLVAASGEPADCGFQARVCGLGICEGGGRLVGPLQDLFKLEGTAGGECRSAYGRAPEGGGDAASKGRRCSCSALFASKKTTLKRCDRQLYCIV